MILVGVLLFVLYYFVSFDFSIFRARLHLGLRVDVGFRALVGKAPWCGAGDIFVAFRTGHVTITEEGGFGGFQSAWSTNVGVTSSSININIK